MDYPKHKKPIAYCEKASSILIAVLIEELGNGTVTIQELYDAIKYDIDAKEVLHAYIERGYGEALCFTYGRRRVDFKEAK